MIKKEDFLNWLNSNFKCFINNRELHSIIFIFNRVTIKTRTHNGFINSIEITDNDEEDYNVTVYDIGEDKKFYKKSIFPSFLNEIGIIEGSEIYNEINNFILKTNPIELRDFRLSKLL